MTRRRTYLPAAGVDWLLPLYDYQSAVLGGDAARRALAEQMALAPGQRVLDIGCGTGTLAVLLKQPHPEVAVVGLDPDPMALARAQRKAQTRRRRKAPELACLGAKDSVPPPGDTRMLTLSGSFL